jgi:hypothetical protein
MMLRPLLVSRRTISRPAKVAISRMALVLAAALALATLPAASDAVAAHYGGHGGGFRGGFHHPGGGFRSGGFRARPGFAVQSGPVFRGAYHHRPFARRFFFNGRYHYYYYGCYRWRYVATPWGWRLRRVNVCYPSYYRYY